MIRSVLNFNENSNSKLQKDCVEQLNKLFMNNHVTDLLTKSYFFVGIRGKYEKIENYCVCFSFQYFNYLFEFHLSYDQLEYYIINKESIVKQCNLEDFWIDGIMISKFIEFLKSDLDNLDIPFNILKEC